MVDSVLNLQLQNRELRVDLLNPAVDAGRLGPRYCWGGYIWQVHDLQAGPLLTGPEWPEPTPSAFNGQGLPESFRHRTLEGRPLTWSGDRGVAVGAGELCLDPAGNVLLIAPCSWEITVHQDNIEFFTRHAAAGFSYALTRRVELNGRAVRSITRLTNLSPHRALTLEWFAHPFFPLVEGAVRAELPVGATLAENPGFTLADRILTQKRRFVRQDEGHMDRGLRLLPDQRLVATIAHPAITEVQFETSFTPDACVIWGNDRTFSFEPYRSLHLAPNDSSEWSVRYRLGERLGSSA